MTAAHRIKATGIVPVKSLKPNPWNTNVVSPENEAKLEASVNRFGMFKPVIVRELADGSLEILGGQHRWQTAKKLGITEVPVVNLGTVDDKTAKEIGLVDNGRYGEDDTLQLAELLKGLGSIEEIGAFLPYTDADLQSIFAASTVALDDLDLGLDDKAPAIPADGVSATHQVMRFKVPVGDCDWITKLIESVMRSQGFMSEDSLSNAGNAFVHICQKLRGS